MALDEYRRKRRPGRTSEPFGPGRRWRGEPIFVVQRHAARRLHYDFRLEFEGALASWAVPKGVPLKPGARALAVHVEDHPLEYATFAGEIPAGQYGAGSVEIWDEGTYELLETKPSGQLTVRLRGERLQGTWSLVPAGLDGKEENWLLIRHRDDGQDVDERRAGVRYAPMLATPADRVPRGADWLFEVKWDGYRALAYLRGGECELVSRNAKPLNERFPEVALALASAIKTPSAVVDGEVCALDERGRSSFSALQQGTGSLVYYAFDLLSLDGRPLVDLPVEERKEKLGRLLDRGNTTVRLSESFEDGDALLRAAHEQGLEGILAKRVGSRYAQGRRGRDWLKLKTHGRQEFIVVGYTRGAGRRSNGFGALVLAVRDGAGLSYVGNVGTGFTDAEMQRLLSLLRPLERPTTPLPELPKLPRVSRGGVVWVEPRLVAEVEFSEWTHEGHIRQPSYKGLRDDKRPDEIVEERVHSSIIRKGRRELRLTNLDKVFWPGEGITKGDLVAYYREIAPVLLPHLRGRPFTMRRYPDGAVGKAFFQKDAPSHMPDWIPTFDALVSPRERSSEQRRVHFPVVGDELALLWMVNMGCIDMNAWYSRIDRPERPDFVLFDLDPTPDVPWAQTFEVAAILKELLDALGLAAFPKTSGGKGLHVLGPVARRSTYENTRRFAELIAGAIARTHPKLATTDWVKARRRGVLIDANQNGEGKTIASVYSVRPRPGAPVSTPVRWEELEDGLDPAQFTMEAVLERVRRHGDLFEPVLSNRQSLAQALGRLRRPTGAGS